MRRIAALLVVLLLAAAPLLSALPAYAAPDVTVNLSEASGPIGATVVVSGTIASAGAHFTVFWDYIRDWDGRYGKIAEGWAAGNSYQVEITIPPASRGDHFVIVRDDNNMETGYAIFTVLPEITVDPSAMPPGGKAKASGFLINGEVIEVYFNGGFLGSNVSDAVTGYFELEFTVPGVNPGTYQVKALWNGEEQASAPFTVLQPPAITLAPSSGYPGDSVTVSGANFAPNSKATIYFDSLVVGEADVDEGGSFTASFNVPGVQPGTYLVTAIDDIYGVPASAAFTVLQQPTYEVAVRPRSMLYYQGDYMSIYVESSTPLQPGTYITVKIYDSKGIPFSEVRIPASQLVEVNGRYYVPYWLSVVSPVIPSDAEVGLWSWEAEYYLPGSANPTRDSGIFAVAPRVSERDLLNMLEGISMKLGAIEGQGNQIIALIENHNNYVLLRLDLLESNIASALFSGFSDVNDKLSSVLAYCSSIDGRLTSIEDGVARIETSLGALHIKVDDLKNLVEEGLAEIKNDVVEIKAGVLNIQASLSDLNAKVDRVESGVVFLNTTLGELSAKVSDLNATLVDVIQDASGEITVKIDTAAGTILMRLDELEAKITNLVLNSKGEIIAKIDSSVGQLNAKLDKLDAVIAEIEGNVTYIKTRIGVIEGDLSAIKNLLEKANATLASIKDGVAEIKVGVGDIKASLSALNATITGIRENLVKIETAIGDVLADLGKIRNLVNGSITEVLRKEDIIIGRINAVEGGIYANLRAVNASLSKLMVDCEGRIIAAVDTAIGTLLVSMEELNATISDVKGDIVVVRTALGEIYISVADILSLTTDVYESIVGENATIVEMLESIKGKTAENTAMLTGMLIPKVNELKPAVESTERRVAETASAMSTVIYVAVAAAVAAAVLSGVNFFLGRRQAAS